MADAARRFNAMSSVLEAHALMTARMDLVLKGHQLSRTAYLVLSSLLVSPGQERALGQLSRVLMVHPTTATLVVDQLEAAGLVQRVPHRTDRRVVLARLTDEGEHRAREASEELAEGGFGLGDLDVGQARALTDRLGEVRVVLGDA
ncbi:MAG: MarR family transcriptional regulator [Frankiales bacterium]|nr:MarR family transcriptional regulator [Frankiales bacterium]